MKNNNEYYKMSDGWFDFYVNVATGEKKFKLDEGDIEVEWEPDDFHRGQQRSKGMMTNENKVVGACWDESDADIGVCYLMLDGEKILRFQDVERYYRNAHKKPECHYLLYMCVWGSCIEHELAAETIEAAKAECEAWLADLLARRIQGLQKSTAYFQGLLNLLEIKG